MTDQEMCDRLVALEILRVDRDFSNQYWPQGVRLPTGFNPLHEAEVWCSWLVAGAVMERIKQKEWLLNLNHDGTVVLFNDTASDYWSDDESPPRAIIEAGVEALSDD